MDGIHDLGGADGYGAIEIELDEPAFHEPWESMAIRLNMASIGFIKAYNADQYRHAVERIAPVDYLRSRYYERMLTGATTLLVEAGILDHADLEERAGGAVPLAQPARPNVADNVAPSGSPRFATGDPVRVIKRHQPGHTRAPRYIRGCTGTVIHVAPAFPYPDASAHGLTPRSEPTYHVEFNLAAVWPEQPASPDDTVVVDLWQTYLEPANVESANV